MKKPKKPNPRLDPAPKRIKDVYYWLRQDMHEDTDRPPFYDLKRTAISLEPSNPAPNEQE